MHTLFPLEPVMPEGFSYLPEFISEAEELDLATYISTLDLHTFNFHGYEARRKVASFGFDWSFEKQTLIKGKAIPAAFEPLMREVADQLNIPKDDFAEVLVTGYPAGSVINWHRDAPPFKQIAGISLLSDCKFRFRPFGKTGQKRGSILSIPVMRRSLYLMTGAAREEWQHAIAPVTQHRYSITLRTLA